jgi:hypothetical protein
MTTGKFQDGLELLGGEVELAVLLPKEIVQVTMRQLWNG